MAKNKHNEGTSLIGITTNRKNIFKRGDNIEMIMRTAIIDIYNNHYDWKLYLPCFHGLGGGGGGVVVVELWWSGGVMVD